MSRFTLTTLRSGSGALRAGLPLGGDTTGIRATTDSSGDLYYAVLDSPLRYRGADVHQVMLRPAQRGQAPHYGMRGFAVEIAPITDPAVRSAAVIDPALLDFVAVGEIDDASDPVQSPIEGADTHEATVIAEDRRPAPPPRPISTPVAGDAKRSRKPLILAATAAVLAAGIATLWLTSSDNGAEPEAASSSPTPTTVVSPTTTQASTVSPVEKPEAVLRLVPPGYKPGACTADAGVPAGALAALSCTRNTDPGGPESGRYTLFSDKSALQAGFDQIMAESTQQICPGRIMSPGPWRHNATPEVAAGTLFCGARQGHPVIAWTDESKRLLAVVDSTGRPGLEEMFTWWSSHS